MADAMAGSIPNLRPIANKNVLHIFSKDIFPNRNTALGSVSTLSSDDSDCHLIM